MSMFVQQDKFQISMQKAQDQQQEENLPVEAIAQSATKKEERVLNVKSSPVIPPELVSNFEFVTNTSVMSFSNYESRNVIDVQVNQMTTDTKNIDHVSGLKGL